MPYSVYQHWDPLKVCIVGRTYPPEFYNWIKIARVRHLFERLAEETEEDFLNLIKKLQQFGVRVLRPNLIEQTWLGNSFKPPPMNPRDEFVMIGDCFYTNYGYDFKTFYANIKDPSWPECVSIDEFYNLPNSIKSECLDIFGLSHHFPHNYSEILTHVHKQGNQIRYHHGICNVNGAMVSRIGRDLYFGTASEDQDLDVIQEQLDTEFIATRNHIVNTVGHSDATFCPICPGLIISLRDIPTYENTFPGWEVVYLEGQSWQKIKPFLDLKEKNQGRWWIPGWEYDNEVTQVVETWLSHWVGFVEETVFDVNMLAIDTKNVIMLNGNEKVLKALDRYGITAHIVPFRHRYFWDGGIHCVTCDLNRLGSIQDFFPTRPFNPVRYMSK